MNAKLPFLRVRIRGTDSENYINAYNIAHKHFAQYFVNKFPGKLPGIEFSIDSQAIRAAQELGMKCISMRLERNDFCMLL